MHGESVKEDIKTQKDLRTERSYKRGGPHICVLSATRKYREVLEAFSRALEGRASRRCPSGDVQVLRRPLNIESSGGVYGDGAKKGCGIEYGMG